MNTTFGIKRISAATARHKHSAPERGVLLNVTAGPVVYNGCSFLRKALGVHIHKNLILILKSVILPVEYGRQ
jgi:hypothetical protein